VALSGDGQYVAVGSENGLSIYDTIGNCRLRFPENEHSLPTNLVNVYPDMSRILIGTREGVLMCLDLKHAGERFRCQGRTLFHTANDFNSLSLSADQKLIALGHLSPALTVIEADGEVCWQRNPDTGTATRGHTWSVAFGVDAEANTLFVGNGGADPFILAALDARTSLPRASRQLEYPVSHLASLPPDKGVVAVLSAGSYDSRVVAFALDLEKILWQKQFAEPVTALATDPVQALLSISIGYEGRIAILEATSGEELAIDQTLRSLVNTISIADGSRLAAGMEDGHIVWLHLESGDLRL
jgi:hypothetical protein